MTTHWTDELVRLGACDSGVAWARRHESIEAAWAACDDGGMMLRYAARVSGSLGSRQKLAIAACDCAEIVLYMYERAFPGDLRPRMAINVARGWARGDGATPCDVRSALSGVYLAAAEADAGSGPDAADAITAAAEAVCAVCAACAIARYAETEIDTESLATFAAIAAAAYSAAAASSDARRRIVAVIRSHYPTPPERIVT